MKRVHIFILLLLLPLFFSQIPSSNVSHIIFQDDYSTVSDWSWGLTPLLDQTISKSGKSLKLVYPQNSGKWPGLYLQFKAEVAASQVKSIEFDVNPQVIPKLQLCLRDPSYVQYCSSSFAPTAQLKVFSHVSIPTTFFQGTTIQSFLLITTDDSYGQTIYLDNIYLAAKSNNSTNNASNNTSNNASNNKSNVITNSTPTPAQCLKNATPPIQTYGNIPDALPNRFLIGLFLDDPNPTWMKSSNVPWDAQYRYLVKGWANNWGWGQYDGTFSLSFFSTASTNGYLPVVQYYQMVGEAPWPNDESKFVAKLQNATTMKSYFNDFILLMKNAKNFSKPVLILMEADGFGYCQIQSNGNSSSYAAISDTGIPELKGLPNTVYGFGLALLQIRKTIGAANAYMGIHISGWATQKDLFFNSQTVPLQPEIDKVYDFLLPFGLNKINVVGQEFDFLVTDPLDRDADFYRLTQNQNRWWNTSDSAPINSTSFNRHIEFLRLFNLKAGKKWILWQIPLGNSNSKNVDNSNNNVAAEGYKDNRPEYFFGDDGLGMCHCRKYSEAGTYALLFGRGEGRQTNYVNDVYNDGQLFMQTRVKKNYYDLGGLALNRTGTL